MKIENKIILFFFIGALLYLWTVFSMGVGVQKERERKICVSPYQIEQWRSTINLTKGVYIKVSDNYKEEIEKADEETEKWRGYYLWCKSQAEEEDG